MPTKDGFHTTKEMILIFLAVASLAFIIAAAGSMVEAGWLVIPVTALFGAAGAYVITRKSSKKTNMISTIVWGSIGLIAGIAWFTTS